MNDYNNGLTNAPTSETWQHALFVAGTRGDDVQLLIGSGGWTDTGTHLTTSGGKIYEHYIPDGQVLGSATANLFIDNILQVNHGTHIP